MECEGLRLETVTVLPEREGEISSSYHRQMAIPQKEIPYAESLVGPRAKVKTYWSWL
jgi:hypothetical protein